MNRRQGSQWRCQAFFWFLPILAVALQSCSNISDNEIAQRFAEHRADFERVAKLGLSTRLSCQATGSEIKCNSKILNSLFQTLHKEADVQSIEARADIPQLGKSVFFVIADYGLITTNSYSKGILYSTDPISPVVENTGDHDDMRFRFRPIADHWYVFVMP